MYDNRKLPKSLYDLKEKHLPENSEASELVVALEIGLKWRREPIVTKKERKKKKPECGNQ